MSIIVFISVLFAFPTDTSLAQDEDCDSFEDCGITVTEAEGYTSGGPSYGGPYMLNCPNGIETPIKHASIALWAAKEKCQEFAHLAPSPENPPATGDTVDSCILTGDAVKDS